MHARESKKRIKDMEEKSDGVGSLFIPHTTFVDILLLALKCATLKMSASFLV